MELTKETKIGILGMGVMHFGMVTGLSEAGYKLILPTYRREIDQAVGFSEAIPDAETKIAAYDAILARGAETSENQVDLIKRSDVLHVMMPNSKFVEMLMYGEEGIINNMRPGTLVIDFTSADPESTRKIAKDLEARGVDMIDASVSGGNIGSSNHTLTIMCGGKEEVIDAYRPVFNVIGKPENVYYVGPHGAGNTIKSCNNFLSCCGYLATTEALTVAQKAGIDPHTAIKVFSTSGGSSHASTVKIPTKVFKGKDFHGGTGMMHKDVVLYTNSAKNAKVPCFMGNAVQELWGTAGTIFGYDTDMKVITKMFEEWCDVKQFGIDEEK